VYCCASKFCDGHGQLQAIKDIQDGELTTGKANVRVLQTGFMFVGQTVTGLCFGSVLLCLKFYEGPGQLRTNQAQLGRGRERLVEQARSLYIHAWVAACVLPRR
jgi:hypothetical protein